MTEKRAELANMWDFQAHMRLLHLHPHAMRLFSDQANHRMDAPDMMPAGACDSDEVDLDDGDGVFIVPGSQIAYREGGGHG